jgi:hypothetical protein
MTNDLTPADEPTVTVTRVDLFVGGLRPLRWHYYTAGPDGTRFDNSSLVTLRQVLRRRYGRQLVIRTAWTTGDGGVS